MLLEAAAAALPEPEPKLLGWRRAPAHELFAVARDLHSVNDAHPGAVAVVQRTDSAMRLNVHIHVLVLDGVYVREPTSGEPERRGRRLAAPTNRSHPTG